MESPEKHFKNETLNKEVEDVAESEMGIQSPLSEDELLSHKYISDIGERAETHAINVYNLVKEKLSSTVGGNFQEVPKLNLVEGEVAKLSLENEVPEIILGKDEFIRDIAETLGEEFGHFLRSKLTNRLSEGGGEYLTDEFFGFLSRRLVFEKLNQIQKQLLFPGGVPSLEATYEGESKGDIVKKLKAVGKIKRELDKEYKLAKERGDTDKIKEISRRVEDEEMKNWFRTITHYRGYEFASQVDLSRITDWKKLFSMPDKEVRIRFFTPNPDYSGL